MRASRPRRAPLDFAMFTLRLLGSVSLDGPNGPVAGRAALRQRLALLALLAVEHPRPLTRDKVIALLWPDSGTDEARHLLRDSLYLIRSALGDPSVVSAGDDLRLSSERLTCDLWEFEAALAAGDLERAIGMCHGPFLSGFHVSGADEFERWSEAERSRMARRFAQTLEQLAERETLAGNHLRAVECWSRLAAEDPYNSRVALRYMEALEGAGDPAGALRHAAVHAELLRSDLDAGPDKEVVALVERLRRELRIRPAGSAAPAATALELASGDGPDDAVALPAVKSRQRTRRWWLAPAVLGLGSVIGLGVLGGALSRERPADELGPRRVAVAAFENRTGRSDLDDLGPMAADWIMRGMLETPLIDVTELEAVYAEEPDDSTSDTNARVLAGRSGARLVVFGNYYRSGDSVLFQASIVDVPSGRVLRSFPPAGGPLENTAGALEALRERIAGGVGALVSPQLAPGDPDLMPPLNLAAYREFMAGLRLSRLDDWESESRHYRRAAEMDSTFMAPLIQLALGAFFRDGCPLTDSIGAILQQRRERLTTWDRLSIDGLRARCRGDMETAVRLLGERFKAYPQSRIAQGQYAALLVHFDRPRAAEDVLRRSVLPGGPLTLRPGQHQVWFKAAAYHVLGRYRDELDLTERWRDSSDGRWWMIRSRATGALGREREAIELFQHLAATSIDSSAELILELATELALHGNRPVAMAVAESLLGRLKGGPPWLDSARALDIAWANRLLGKKDGERAALQRLAPSGKEDTECMDGQARLALLVGDTARAEHIDSVLAEQDREPITSPWVHGARLIARSHIQAGLGRRDQAIALLQEARNRGMIYLGAAYFAHADPLFAPLRGYPPFEALLHPND
jgi:DNA-binding SARP family transcriptional activator